MYLLCGNSSSNCNVFFFFNDTATTEIYTLSLHDALLISARTSVTTSSYVASESMSFEYPRQDRKSTRLNSSHPSISYAVFCLKTKTQNPQPPVLAVADDIPRAFMHMAKALHDLFVADRLAGDRLRRVVVIGDDEVEHLPARQRIMHDVAFRPGPQRRRVPAQIFRHLLSRDHRAIRRVP